MGRLMDAEAEAPQKTISPDLNELAETIGKQANATAVFGSPIVDGDRTVIPVAQARFAVGVGDGLIAKGLGGGMTAKPLGFIVIDRDGVRFQRTPQPSLAAAGARRRHWARARDAAQASVFGECALADAFDGAAPQGAPRSQGGMRIPRAAPGIESQ